MPFMPFQPASHKRKKHYRIGEHIGTGGYGEVKRAIMLNPDGTAGRDVAIKIIPKVKIADVSMQVTRQNSLLKFDHPHVVKLYEWFESKDKFYLVFELAAGGELYDHLIAESRFEEAEAKEVAFALIDAIRYIHSMGVVHRDLKPENILYRTPPGSHGAGHDDCVVSDFGLAEQINHPDQRLFTVCGSAGYTAPEVYSGEGYGLPVDMWSLGVVIFAMMGGRFPFKNTEPKALAHEAHTTELYFPPVWANVSDDARDFVRKLLNVDPAKRMTATEAYNHPWLRSANSRPPSPTNNANENTLPGSHAEHLEQPAFPPLEKRITTVCDPSHKAAV